MKITFYRSALNSKGVVYKSSIASFNIPDSIPEEEAISKAIEMFEKEFKLSKWTELAEVYETS